MSKKEILRKLLRAAACMVQGGLSETTRRCGKPNCACARDPKQRHGPHLYVTYRSQGKSRGLYVPAERAGEARRAHAAWAEFWEAACALAARNREQLQHRWAGERRERRKRRD